MRNAVIIVAFLAAFPAAGSWTSAAAQAVGERSAEATSVSGVVFADSNGNGTMDAGERGVEGVLVSDQEQVVATDAAGRFTLEARGYGIIEVVQPEGWAVEGAFWRRVERGASVSFALRPWDTGGDVTFVHASDTHVSAQSVGRLRRVREMVDSIAPDFVIITGDLVRDALRVTEAEARGYYELLEAELAAFSVPVYTVPGNHEKFGIERHNSLIGKDHPLYGNRMYRTYRGPNYHAFHAGGVLFMGLDDVDYDDLWYYGNVDSLQLAWMDGILARTGADTPVVTFGHIPFMSANMTRYGYTDEGLAPTLIRIDGVDRFRHVVANHEEVLRRVGDRLAVALAGHIHVREITEYETQGGSLRLETAAAVVGPAAGVGGDRDPISGITVYRVRDGKVDGGEFLALEGR